MKCSFLYLAQQLSTPGLVLKPFLELLQVQFELCQLIFKVASIENIYLDEVFCNTPTFGALPSPDTKDPWPLLSNCLFWIPNES